MKIVFIAFTEKGTDTCLKMAGNLGEHQCACYAKGSFPKGEGVSPLHEPLSEWTGNMFAKKDAIVFIGAVGIAVRAIAPYVKDKREDPAVIAVDEQGQYVIPLLSGHIGGANKLADQLARTLGATAIITTATDLNDRFAVDQWAEEQKMVLSDMGLAKQVSADLLQNKQVGFFSAFPIEGNLPEGLVSEKRETNIEVSLAAIVDRKNTLQLIPRAVVLGIGCRSGIPQSAIEDMVAKVLEDANISMKAVKRVASIDLKKEELGLLSFCQSHGLPFYTYSAIELAAAPGEFTKSSFVTSVTGVDNVCERAAVIGSRGGRLLTLKQAGDGVTVALALEEKKYTFEC